MPNNTIKLGFFGNPDIRWQTLASLWGYFVLGISIGVFNFLNLAMPFMVAQKDIKRWIANRGDCHIPSATTCGGLVGYVFGLILCGRFLGTIPPERNSTVYSFPEKAEFHGLELKDPDTAIHISYSMSIVLGVTTAFGIGVAELAAKTNRSCILPAYRAMRARCGQDNRAVARDNDNDLEGLTLVNQPG